MGCCLGKPAEENKDPLIYDVQRIIENEVWQSYCDVHPWCQRRLLRRSDFIVDVPMNYYHFEKVKQDVKLRSQPQDAGASGSKGKGPQQPQLSHRHETSPEHTGLQTHFRNSTAERQTYNFKFEKTRRAAVNVSYQKGFSIGSKTNFSINLPKILPGGEIGTEIDMRLEVTKRTEQTFEETLTTSATSDITVSPYSHYVANVHMEERNLTAEFKVLVLMTMPAKKAEAFVRNKAGEVVHFYKLNNLKVLFPKQAVKGEDGKDRQDAVQFVVEGMVSGIQLSSHRIELDSEALPRPDPDPTALTSGRSGGGQ